jgi:hypothetical protein
VVGAAVTLVLLGSGCGARSTGASPARRQAFLDAVHLQVPLINQVRSDTSLLRLGAAACAGFASGVSFYSLADTMAVNDGDLAASDLGTVIKSAADTLCPSYRARVSP